MITSDICPPVLPLFTKATVLRPPADAARASLHDRNGFGDPTPKSLGGTKKSFAYEMKKKKTIGAMNARINVPSQFRKKTMVSVLSTSVQVWRMNAIVVTGRS